MIALEVTEDQVVLTVQIDSWGRVLTLEKLLIYKFIAPSLPIRVEQPVGAHTTRAPAGPGTDLASLQGSS